MRRVAKVGLLFSSEDFVVSLDAAVARGHGLLAVL